MDIEILLMPYHDMASGVAFALEYQSTQVNGLTNFRWLLKIQYSQEYNFFYKKFEHSHEKILIHDGQQHLQGWF